MDAHHKFSDDDDGEKHAACYILIKPKVNFMIP